ncbi:hypothetical protein BC829DRAFT_301294 [Chytridium lagenaria]|nr:hypothetical protein BC829DRAFT_301294 [Chytridium lagenaria]
MERRLSNLNLRGPHITTCPSSPTYPSHPKNQLWWCSPLHDARTRRRRRGYASPYRRLPCHASRSKRHCSSAYHPCHGIGRIQGLAEIRDVMGLHPSIKVPADWELACPVLPRLRVIWEVELGTWEEEGCRRKEGGCEAEEGWAVLGVGGKICEGDEGRWRIGCGWFQIYGNRILRCNLSRTSHLRNISTAYPSRAFYEN